MDITTLSNEGLLSLHTAIIKALEFDDQAKENKPFGARESHDWRQWASLLEAEMKERNIDFKDIPW